jgi:hypothetical protein
VRDLVRQQAEDRAAAGDDPLVVKIALAFSMPP